MLKRSRGMALVIVLMASVVLSEVAGPRYPLRTYLYTPQAPLPAGAFGQCRAKLLFQCIQAAADRGLPGAVITLSRSLVVPFLKFSEGTICWSCSRWVGARG